MQEIEFLKHLVADAEHELKYIDEYQREVVLAREDNARYAKLWKMRNPSKQRVRDDLRMIRRITLAIERRI